MKRGVRRCRGLTSAAAAASAEAEGAVAVVLDTTGVRTKTGVLTAAGQALGAGENFGANLDALYDVLRDCDSPTAIVWSGWRDLIVSDGRAFDAIFDVFQARAEDADLLVMLCDPDGT